ncbi:MAG: PEP-CTERM sorting domain-containing protein [Pirellulaceae bacterium]|nr:PEP-CTERM sorting domain-containing protein [Pirellulaceae bacterium]
MSRLLVAFTISTLILCEQSPIARGSLILLTTPGNCTQVGNLVTNGSFESVGGNGPSGDGPANQVFWATGTSLSPFGLPAGWNSSGNANSYAVWGNDASGPPYTLRNSEQLPNGRYGMYFGNGAHVTVNLPPNFHADGRVTFPGTPTFTQPLSFPTPVELWQQIPTASNPAPKYCFSFWASGESVLQTSDPQGILMGIFGLQVTNVLPGDPVIHLTVPSAPDSPIGGFKRYDFEFVPLNSSLDVTIKFINYGHLDLTSWGRGPTTELVIDDVIINGIPEPSALYLVFTGWMMISRLRRRRSRAC